MDDGRCSVLFLYFSVSRDPGMFQHEDSFQRDVVTSGVAKGLGTTNEDEVRNSRRSYAYENRQANRSFRFAF